jgi:hypothetical protein
MDPIHPIVPLPPTIAPVTPAPMVGRVDRDQPHGAPGDENRRRRRARSEHGSDAELADGLGYVVGPDGEDDEGLHVNVTA